MVNGGLIASHLIQHYQTHGLWIPEMIIVAIQKMRGLKYNRTPIIQTLKGNEGLFEFRGRVIGIHQNIQFSTLIINSFLIYSTSVLYNTAQIKPFSRETNTFCNNCNDS